MDKRLVIIPTYNEKENIANIIRAVFSLIDVHILIIDDGSPDGTAGIVKELMREFPGRLFLEEREGKLGLGTAYIHGFKWGLKRNYGYLFEMDADFSHDPHDLQRLYEACVGQNAGLAIGSRYCSGVNVLNWPMSRLLMSYCGSMYVRFILGIPVRDTTAGFKCYRAETLRAIDFSRIRHAGYGFQIEMKYTVWKLGFKIVEVPIVFRDRTQGTSKMSSGIFKEAIFGVIGLRLRNMFRKWKRMPLERAADKPEREQKRPSGRQQPRSRQGKTAGNAADSADGMKVRHDRQPAPKNRKAGRPDRRQPNETDNNGRPETQNTSRQSNTNRQTPKPRQQPSRPADKNRQEQEQPTRHTTPAPAPDRQRSHPRRRPPRKPADGNRPAVQNDGPHPDAPKEQ